MISQRPKARLTSYETRIRLMTDTFFDLLVLPLLYFTVIFSLFCIYFADHYQYAIIETNNTHFVFIATIICYQPVPSWSYITFWAVFYIKNKNFHSRCYGANEYGVNRWISLCLACSTSLLQVSIGLYRAKMQLFLMVPGCCSMKFWQLFCCSLFCPIYGR